MTLTRLKISPTGMRLHEWVAMERGFFQAEGIEPEIRWDVVLGTMERWKGEGYKERPQDKPFLAGEQTVTNACAWGSICNAGAGMGKFVPDAHGVARWAIWGRPPTGWGGGSFRPAPPPRLASLRNSRRCASPWVCAPAATSTCRTASKR